jgi:cytochrome c-type biogenesis protein CcmH/NrfF
MRFVWVFPLAILVVGAGVLFIARRRAGARTSLPSEPVSSQWLAEARGREENRW